MSAPVCPDCHGAMSSCLHEKKHCDDPRRHWICDCTIASQGRGKS